MERDFQPMQWLHVCNCAEAWIGEHHSGGYEIYGRPKLFIATAAERTRYIRLGTGVISLPYLLICQAHTISGGWGLAMAQGREGQFAYGDIIQAAIGDRAAPRHAYGAPGPRRLPDPDGAIIQRSGQLRSRTTGHRATRSGSLAPAGRDHPIGGLVANAVANALTSFGAMPNQLPLSPARVWHMSSAK